MLDAQTHTPPLGGARRGGRVTGQRAAPRPGVVALAFAVAIGLGVVIGLATAPGGSPKAATSHSTTVALDPAIAAPALPAASWDANRVPGTGQRAKVRPADRQALIYVLAATQHRPAADVAILPDRLFYGAVEGASAASDVYWAVGPVTIASVAAPPNPVVWKRVGAHDWQVVARGAGACAAIPAAMTATGGAWGGGQGTVCAGA
jgi:hypothetical protein